MKEGSRVELAPAETLERGRLVARRLKGVVYVLFVLGVLCLSLAVAFLVNHRWLSGLLVLGLGAFLAYFGDQARRDRAALEKLIREEQNQSV